VDQVGWFLRRVLRSSEIDGFCAWWVVRVGDVQDYVCRCRLVFEDVGVIESSIGEPDIWSDFGDQGTSFNIAN
jgi:hypothetical protein